jgi:hypothetical protein
VEFKQYGPNCVNVGVTLAVTATIIVVEVAQRPAVGVKVYVIEPIAAVDIAVFQVPLIPFEEIVGSIPGAAFKQYGPNCVNVGIVGVLTVTAIGADVAEEPVKHAVELDVKTHVTISPFAKAVFV